MIPFPFDGEVRSIDENAARIRDVEGQTTTIHSSRCDTTDLTKRRQKDVMSSFGPLSTSMDSSTYTERRKRPSKVADLRKSVSSAGAENQINRSPSKLSPSKLSPGRSLSDRVLNLSRSQRKQLLFENKKKSSISDRSQSLPKEATPHDIPQRPSSEESSVEMHVAELRKTPSTISKVSKASSKSLTEIQTPKNKICLHVYDLISNDALMLIPPFGCIVEIGRCFANMNSALHELGTGAYHVGIEVNGVEYAYGATSQPGRTGVFTCFPKMSPGYQYRTTINLGERPLTRRTVVLTGSRGEQSESERTLEATAVLKEMALEYLGTDYDILRKNCCSFACDACQRLGVPNDEIPSWFRNLAESGAATQDVAMATVQPIASVLSTFEDAENNEERAPTKSFALGRMCE